MTRSAVSLLDTLGSFFTVVWLFPLFRIIFPWWLLTFAESISPFTLRYQGDFIESWNGLG